MSDTHAQTVAFVRDTMTEQQEPPLSQSGAYKWMRENLLSTPLNVILTLVSVWLIYSVLSHVMPWAVFGIWDASSLSECRTIRDELYGADANVACWAVISERWKQLLFGFYPPEHYWRPVLAFVLFLVAISPVLFSSLPRKLLAFSVVAPFILFWLIWGGTIWGPICVALGFVIGWAIIRYASPYIGALGSVILAIVVPLLYWFVLAGPLDDLLASILPIGLEQVQSKQMGGFMLAMIIGISGIALSLPLGIVLALGRQSDLFLINKCSVIFIEVIRGVPLIVWLFTASLLLNYFLPPGTNFDLMLRVIIMVTLFSSAYIAEVVRGGLAALPKGQYEAADALGLDYWKSMRLVILPQALKISIPGIVNTFIGLFKDTTLVVFIGLLDPIGLSNAIRASTEWNGIYWELFVFIGLCFFIFCFSMGRYSLFLEKKLRREHR
ncbi:amino acid ABC transporter permease [Salipiger sp. HF18]|uniref:L-glutamine ABC transporter membrane protein/L-glutamate ABC transporter membrane protein/L-aspartate ABC transporter membrane protein/L-asparagine ABC transporter membrane protein n=1 Tax=Salipiger thiooxidans TaxID=282683 RepID=A0A1G7AYD2_9RHOB|nr:MULTISPECIES: amino acid ABC transporter permease [Salipiger]NIY99478.1 amino acid ABC transporter permease [Salipiger sp. HF18]SDE18976.1 L-glutamine ABC transporter membrane protein/L-glutamate ABC transporter membrane protein/L-aspartate ABC transporter membrane protein/L-asparagine ABC transporter membrane protein [Salipiger thiooxidans]